MEQNPRRRRCVRTKKDGSPCEKPPIKGATVCASHGGKAKHIRDAAALRLVEEEARKGLARLDVSPIEDPLTELAKLAGEVVSWKDQLAAQVNALTGDPCPHCGGGGRFRYEAVGAGTEQLRAEVGAFERSMDRCVHVLATMAKLNIEERLARISERQAEAVIRALDAALASAGVAGEAAQRARAVAARELRNAA